MVRPASGLSFGSSLQRLATELDRFLGLPCEREVNVAYVTVHDPSDLRKGAGVAYYMARALAAQSLSLTYVGPLESRFSLSKVTKIPKGFYVIALRRNYDRARSPLLARSYARKVARYLSSVHSVDAILSPSTIPIGYLSADRPIVFWVDATFAGALNFYPEYTNLPRSNIEAGHALEQAALDRASLAIYTSDWAARTAIEYYGVDPRKIEVVPFGANVDRDFTEDEVARFIDQRPPGVCNLVFVGADWTRKGGDVALEVTRRLNNSGVRTRLTVIGAMPQLPEDLRHLVRAVGFVAKSTDEPSPIVRLVSESHFLILPSRADFSPHAICEANALGVPSLTTDVGGIPTLVKDEVNGRMFDVQASPDEYCRYVRMLLGDYDRYRQLAESSFREYQARLNWNASCRTVKNLLESVVKGF